MTRRRTSVSRQIQADREVGRRPDVQLDGIADDHLSGVQGHGRVAAEGERPVRSRHDRRLRRADTDMRGPHHYRRRTERLRQADSHRPPANARASDHSNRLIVEPWEHSRNPKAALRAATADGGLRRRRRRTRGRRTGRRGCGRAESLLSSSPRGDPSFGRALSGLRSRHGHGHGRHNRQCHEHPSCFHRRSPCVRRNTRGTDLKRIQNSEVRMQNNSLIRAGCGAV